MTFDNIHFTVCDYQATVHAENTPSLKFYYNGTRFAIFCGRGTCLSRL